jgi:proline iminopeptidase
VSLNEPYDEGLLDVGDGQQVYWQTGGTRGGKPALVVHGGPGSGFVRGGFGLLRRAGYQLVLFDQRGCGASTPHASDPAAGMRANTTQHLIADMERLREHLGIDRWLLYGVSWGTTLSLAYAEQHPDRVSALVLAAVCAGRRRDIDFLYREAGRFYPGPWARFAAGSGAPPGGDILGGYARLVEDPDPAVRERTALVRLCAHYFSHGLFLDDGQLIRDAGQLAGIPGVMVHGRLDLNGPAEGAWELSRVWPDGQLLIADDAGHLDSETKTRYLREAVTRFAAR